MWVKFLSMLRQVVSIGFIETEAIGREVSTLDYLFRSFARQLCKAEQQSSDDHDNITRSIFKVHKTINQCWRRSEKCASLMYDGNKLKPFEANVKFYLLPFRVDEPAQPSRKSWKSIHVTRKLVPHRLAEKLPIGLGLPQGPEQ